MEPHTEGRLKILTQSDFLDVGIPTVVSDI